MTHSDLERELRDHYRTMDAGVSGLATSRVADALDRAPAGHWIFGRVVPARAVLTAVVAVAAAAVLTAALLPVWHGPPIAPGASASAPVATGGAASQTPSPSSSLSAPSPFGEAPTATLGPAKCKSEPEVINYSTVGWRAGRVLVLATHFVGCSMLQELLSVDPAVGQWRTDVPLTDTVGDWSTDGSSIATSTGNGFLVVDAADKPHDITSSFGGHSLYVLPGGGYLVVGADKLYRIASDGIGVTSDPLPAGYVIVAPTSDPNMFILATAAEANIEYGLSRRSPFEAYLWNVRTGHLKLVASAIGSVERSPNSLAYLDMTDSAWSTLSLAADGSTAPVARPAALSVSPDGSHYLHSSDPSPVGAVTFQMRLTSTNQVLSEFQGYNGVIVWSGNTAAFVSGPAPDEVTGAGAGQERLVIVDGATVKWVPLP